MHASYVQSAREAADLKYGVSNTQVSSKLVNLRYAQYVICLREAVKPKYSRYVQGSFAFYFSRAAVKPRYFLLTSIQCAYERWYTQSIVGAYKVASLSTLAERR